MSTIRESDIHKNISFDDAIRIAKAFECKIERKGSEWKITHFLWNSSVVMGNNRHDTVQLLVSRLRKLYKEYEEHIHSDREYRVQNAKIQAVAHEHNLYASDTEELAALERELAMLREKKAIQEQMAKTNHVDLIMELIDTVHKLSQRVSILEILVKSK